MVLEWPGAGLAAGNRARVQVSVAGGEASGAGGQAGLSMVALGRREKRREQGHAGEKRAEGEFGPGREETKGWRRG